MENYFLLNENAIELNEVYDNFTTNNANSVQKFTGNIQIYREYVDFDKFKKTPIQNVGNISKKSCQKIIGSNFSRFLTGAQLEYAQSHCLVTEKLAPIQFNKSHSSETSLPCDIGNANRSPALINTRLNKIFKYMFEKMENLEKRMDSFEIILYELSEKINKLTIQNFQEELSRKDEKMMDILKNKTIEYESKIIRISMIYDERIQSLVDELEIRDQILLQLENSDNSGKRDNSKTNLNHQIEKVRDEKSGNCTKSDRKIDQQEQNLPKNKIVFDEIEFNAIQFILYKFMIGESQKSLAGVLLKILPFTKNQKMEIMARFKSFD